MEKFSIGNDKIKVNFVSDMPLIDYFQKNHSMMEIYDYKIGNIDFNYPIVIYKNGVSNQTILVRDNCMIITYPMENLIPENILFMGTKYLEKQHLKNSMVTCHSACVEKNGKALLIVGESGSGKTSLAINLCLKKGYSLVSNDMSLIGIENDELFVYWGTKFINLRLESVRSNMPELLELFRDKKLDAWLTKIKVMPKDIGIFQSNGIFPINKVIYIHIDSRENLYISKGDTWRNNFLMYQNISSHITNQASSFVDKNGHNIGYVPSFDSYSAYYERTKIIELINERCYNVTGSIDECVNLLSSAEYERKRENVKNK